jgi:hypothetical protein
MRVHQIILFDGDKVSLAFPIGSWCSMLIVKINFRFLKETNESLIGATCNMDLLELPQQNRQRRSYTTRRKYARDNKQEKTKICCELCYRWSPRGCRHFNMVYRQQEIQKLVQQYNQGRFDFE